MIMLPPLGLRCQYFSNTEGLRPTGVKMRPGLIRTMNLCFLLPIAEFNSGNAVKV